MYNKKIFIYALTFFSILLNVSGQTIIFNKKADLPSARRNGAAIACNGKIYYIAGYAQPNTGPLNTIFEYDPATDSWQEKNVKPTKCSNLALVAIGEKIYAIGGDPFLDKNEVYNTATDSWESKTDMPTKRQHVNCGVVNGKIYVMGGLTNWSNISVKNECYDPATDTWEKKAPLPVPRHGPNPNVTVLNGIIYVIGGYGYGEGDIWTPLQTVQAYDPITDQWSLKNEIPSPYSLGAIVINQTLYILTDEGDHTKIYTYDPAMDTWNYIDNTQLLWQQAGITVLNDVIYYIGGNDINFTAYYDVFEGKLDLTDYFGQAPPGDSAIIFAPNIISGKFSLHGFPTFAPKGKEVYWPVLPPKIMYMKYTFDSWSSPEEVSFSENNSQAPCFSPDGNRIYYQVTREGGQGGLDIWYVERSGSGWSEPKNLGIPINSKELEGQPTFTKNGTIYFSGTLEGVMINRGIYRSKFINGRYQKPELLPEQINSKYLDIYPFIATDESYLLFCSTRPSMEEKNRRIFISFHLKNDSWSEPVNLNERINFDVQSSFPYITPDGKYLFFCAESNMQWISSKVIDQLREQILGDKPQEDTLLYVSFHKSAQDFDTTETMNIALADIDDDGDLDAVLANKPEGRIWLNDGTGYFTDSGQKLAEWGHGVALDDLDSDGDKDIFLVRNGAPSKVYLNNGKGRFQDNGQSLGDIDGKYINGLNAQLADVDGDNDIDALVGYNNSNYMFWLNDGNGIFSKSDIQFDMTPRLCDLDGDGDIDVFCKKLGYGYKTMLNDGKGNFKKIWDIPDSTVTYGQVRLADFDADGDPDAFITNGDYSGSSPTTVWINDGKGRFTDSGQNLGRTIFARVVLADFNKDGHVDAFISNVRQHNQIWLNNEGGLFIDSGLRLSEDAVTAGCAVGDLDRDGDLDIFVAVPLGGTNEVWLNKLNNSK